MATTKMHVGPLPDPVATMGRHFRDGGIELVHAVFESSFFVDPEAVRARTPYYPDRARMSREHYPKVARGEHADWNGRRVRLGDNARAQMAWAKYTGRDIARGTGYGVRHVWGHPWDPDAFTAGWNLCYMPFWAGMLTEEQHPHELVEKAVRQASWDLYFRDRPVCPPPGYVRDPGLDLGEVLGGRPLLLLARPRESASDATTIETQTATATVEDRVRSLRRRTNQSWSNLEKGALAILGRLHGGFGTANVEASSKSVVRRIERETGMKPEDLLKFIAAERARG